MDMNTIFCLPKDIEIENINDELIWGFQHPNAETVVILPESQLYHYDDLGIWLLTNEITQGYYIDPHSGDSIYEIDKLQKLYDAYTNLNIKNDPYFLKIIFILDYAIRNRKPVHFYW